MAFLGSLLTRVIWFSFGIVTHSAYERWHHGRKNTVSEEPANEATKCETDQASDYDFSMEREDNQDNEDDTCFVSRNLHEGHNLPPYSRWPQKTETNTT